MVASHRCEHGCQRKNGRQRHYANRVSAKTKAMVFQIHQARMLILIWHMIIEGGEVVMGGGQALWRPATARSPFNPIGEKGRRCCWVLGRADRDRLAICGLAG